LAAAALCAVIMVGCDDAPVDTDAGSTLDAGSALDAGASDAGGARDAGPGADAGPADAGGPDAGTPDAGATTELEVRVVVRDPITNAYEPSDGVFVRVDGSDGSTVEGETDSAGVVALTLDAASAPWTVTAARAGHTATSIFGVTGPIDGAIHLSPNAPVTPTTRMMSGMISGRSVPTASVFLDGPGVTNLMVSDDTYTAEVSDDATTALRVLAVEWETPDLPPANAVWLDIDRSRADLSMTDIALPDPPRAVVDTPMTVTIPTMGLLAGSTFTVVAGSNRAFRQEAAFFHSVGRVGATDAGAGAFDLLVQAFDSDMEPTHVSLDLTDGSAVTLLATAPFASGSTWDVPAVEQLEWAGATLGAGTVTWNAPAYAHLGASVVNESGAGGWFIYSYDAVTTDLTITWPQLPAGLTILDLDLGLAAGAAGRANTFALSYATDVRPWEWTRLGERAAVVVAADVELTGR